MNLRRVSVPDLADRYGIGFLVYCGISVASALTEWLIFVAALLVVGPVTASIAGFLVATTVNFILCHTFAFRSTRPYFQEFVLIVGMSAIAFTANFAAFYVLYSFAEINIIVAKVVGTFFGFSFNYAIRQFYIFSRIPNFPALSRILARNKHAGRSAHADPSGSSTPLASSTKRAGHDKGF